MQTLAQDQTIRFIDAQKEQVRKPSEQQQKDKQTDEQTNKEQDEDCHINTIYENQSLNIHQSSQQSRQR